jgi:hypothetical protein
MTFAAIRETGKTTRTLSACTLGIAIFSGAAMTACKKQGLIGTFDGTASISANIWQGTNLKARVDKTFDGLRVSVHQGTVGNTLVLDIEGAPFTQKCSLDLTPSSEKAGNIAKQTCPVTFDGQAGEAMMDGPVSLGDDNPNEMKISAGGDAPKDGGKVFFHMNFSGTRTKVLN